MKYKEKRIKYSKTLHLRECTVLYCQQYIKDMNDIMENKFSKSFLDNLLNCNDIDKKYDKRNFIHSIQYQDGLLLFLIFYSLFPNTDFKKIERLNFIPGTDTSSYSANEIPLILAFDNIDHMEIESFNCEFPKKIKGTLDNCISIFKHKIQLHSIFCLRDANFSLVNRQLEEIVNSKEINFNPVNHDEIIIKRINIAKKDNINIDLNQTRFIDLMFLNWKYAKKKFLPLFNFNYRKLVNFIIDTPLKLENNTIDMIDELSKSQDSIHGARGIIFFFLIKLLRSKDCLKQTLLIDDKNIPEEGKVEIGSLNPSRLLLTILHNINKSNLDSNTAEFQILDRRAPLYDLYFEYSKLFKKDINGEYFFYILTRLFLCHKDNISHLISFTNKEVYDENSFNNEKMTLTKAKSKNNNNAKKAKDILNKIEIQINPSGFSYLNDIIKHYEFFSFIKANNKKPLFCCINLGNNNNPKFFKNIDKTFLKVKECVGELEEFIRAENISAFKSGNYCFKKYQSDEDERDDEVEGKPRLYLVRIIHTHVNYIDTLRYCVLELDVLKRAFLDKGISENDYLLHKKNINNTLLNKISNYVDLLPEFNDEYIERKNRLQKRVSDEINNKKHSQIIK